MWENQFSSTQSLEAVTEHYNNNVAYTPNILRVVLCAPIGKAAYHISGGTVRSAFSITVRSRLQGLASKLQEFQLAFQTVKMVIIDEVSMLSRSAFDNVDCRLQEIMNRPNEFCGGLHILFAGDLFQLAPQGRYLFMGNELGNPWLDHIEFFELTEIIRQRDDAVFAEALNRLQEGAHKGEDLQLFRS